MHIGEDLIRKIQSALPKLRILENEPMREHCSFRIGGPVRLMVLPSGPSEAIAVCGILREGGVEPLIMGKGTNLLVSDKALDIAVIKMDSGMAYIEREDECTLRAGSGTSLAKMASEAQRLGLAGMEFAHGIPGSLGGAVSMNAGAYGGEMKDIIAETLYIGEDMAAHSAKGEEHGFAYRRSAFSNSGRVILESRIRLTAGKPEEIQARMRELLERRRASQPLDIPSAGSTFKRPEGAYAAQLIDEADLKGFRIGGAQVSPKHAGFIVNTGGASFDDVRSLMRHIQQTVFTRTGILLEPEVKIIE